MDDVIDIEQRFVVFGGEADWHKDECRCAQIHQVFGGEFGVGLRPFD